MCNPDTCNAVPPSTPVVTPPVTPPITSSVTCGKAAIVEMTSAQVKSAAPSGAGAEPGAGGAGGELSAHPPQAQEYAATAIVETPSAQVESVAPSEAGAEPPLHTAAAECCLT